MGEQIEDFLLVFFAVEEALCWISGKRTMVNAGRVMPLLRHAYVVSSHYHDQKAVINQQCRHPRLDELSLDVVWRQKNMSFARSTETKGLKEHINEIFEQNMKKASGRTNH